MSIVITDENCREVIKARLCTFPYDQRIAITNAICSIFKNFAADCDNITDCETLTSLSEFTSSDGQVCITYTDEKGDTFERCFTIVENEIVITADSGVNKDTPTNVQLGGDLLKDTTIGSNGFTISIAGLALYNSGGGQLTSYGIGTFVDTPVYGLGVLADGTIIEYIPSTVDVVITADNGLTANTDTNVQLGGTLDQTTTILSNGFDISVSGLTLYDSGSIQFVDYGVGTFANTPVYFLGVDSIGNIVETLLDTGNIVFTADNGLSKDIPSNVQLGSASPTGAPLLHDSYISGAFNLSLQDGTLTVGTTTPISAKITAKTTFASDFFSILGVKQGAVGGLTGAGIASEGQFLVSGGTTYNNTAPLGGLYGELGFQGSGSWSYINAAKYVQLGGLSAVMTIYTVDASNYNSGNSIFSGGQYFVNVAGTGNIDKFASIRALYPITTPGLSYAGTITDHYGLYIDDHLDGNHALKITNRWGVYQAGIGESNKFNGKMFTPNLQNFANDATAAIGGIAIGQQYRNGSVVQVRVT